MPEVSQTTGHHPASSSYSFLIQYNTDWEGKEGGWEGKKGKGGKHGEKGVAKSRLNALIFQHHSWHYMTLDTENMHSQETQPVPHQGPHSPRWHRESTALGFWWQWGMAAAPRSFVREPVLPVLSVGVSWQWGGLGAPRLLMDDAVAPNCAQNGGETKSNRMTRLATETPAPCPNS